MNFTFNIDQVNLILQSLDQMPHAKVRQLIDVIIAEANKQMQTPAPAAPAQEEIE